MNNNEISYIERVMYRQSLLSDLILHDMPEQLLREISVEISTEELEHLLALMIESNLVKNNVELSE